MYWTAWFVRNIWCSLFFQGSPFKGYIYIYHIHIYIKWQTKKEGYVLITHTIHSFYSAYSPTSFPLPSTSKQPVATGHSTPSSKNKGSKTWHPRDSQAVVKTSNKWPARMVLPRWYHGILRIQFGVTNNVLVIHLLPYHPCMVYLPTLGWM